MATHPARFLTALIICLMIPAYLVIRPGPLLAQTPDAASSGSAIAPALNHLTNTGAPATKENHELSAGGVSATITVLRTGQSYPAGGSAFARIELNNSSKSKRVGAELALETGTASIRDISGKKLTLRQEGALRIVSVDKIAPRKPRSIIVELRLQEGEQPNTLKVTLRQPPGAGESVNLEWKVANCAAAFYSQLVRVREGSGAGLADAVKAARARDRTRPGRWLFPPRFKNANAARTCVRRAKRWNKRRGRYVYRCTRYKTIRPAATAGTPVAWERSVYNFASRWVSARARDRELSQTRDSGWATNRVSQNLQGFLNQERHPALCTGVIPFFNYFDERMAGFLKRAKKFDDMAGKAASLAMLRSSEAIDDVKAEPGGHPGWGSAPLDLPQGAGEQVLKRRVEALARLADNAALSERIAKADSTFAALRAMSEFLSAEGKSLAAPQRASMTRALSAIEAAEYIGTVTRHYGALRHALSGSMSALRQAHADNCPCGG